MYWDMIFSVLGEAVLYFILLFYVACFAGHLWYKRNRPVIMTGCSDRGKIAADDGSFAWRLFFFRTTFTDKYWPMRIGRKVWLGRRIGRIYIAYGKAGLVIALWSGPLKVGNRRKIQYVWNDTPSYAIKKCCERHLLWHWSIRWSRDFGFESYWSPIRRSPRTEDDPRWGPDATQDDDFIF